MESDINRDEIRKAIGKMKDKKAAGIDGFPNEAWKYGGNLKEWVWDYCNRIWKGEGLAGRLEGGNYSTSRKKGKRKGGGDL